MFDSNKKIKYFAYCRKSTEDKKRQIASILDQTNIIETIIDREKLTLVEKPFTEEKTAKNPGRLVFNEMLQRIEEGEANGILCWDIDRLYRNPIDEGRVRWMLQNGIIQLIRTPSRSFYPDDAGLLMGVEGGRATDYVIRLSKNVKRRFAEKVRDGWRPTNSPQGYLSVGDEGNKTIVPDPERFDLIRKCIDLLLTGNYSVSRMINIGTKWGLRTRPTRKLGGKPFTPSMWYRMLNDPFYYGWFRWKNSETGEVQLFRGKHKPMITEQEYRRIQLLLGKKGKPQPKTHQFPFTGLMICGECGSSITAEEKNQLICSACKHKFAYKGKTACPKCGIEISRMYKPTVLYYIYYHCTKGRNRSCKQRSVRGDELERQYEEQLQRIRIDQDYLKLALNYLQETQELEVRDEKTIRQSLQLAYDNCQTRITKLNKEYTSPQNLNYALYSPEEFQSLKRELLQEKSGIEQELQRVKAKVDKTQDLSVRTFNFCAYALHHFENGDFQTKKEIFSAIGSNLTLKDKKLFIEALKPYMLIENSLSSIHAQCRTIEPSKNGFVESGMSVFETSIPRMRGFIEAVRTWIRDNQDNYQVPDLSPPIEEGLGMAV